MKVQDTFNTEVLHGIESMELSEAREHCLGLIEGTKTKANKKAALIRDLNNAPTPRELSRIMWNIMLAGEGLATTNSAWQRAYG